MHTIYFLTCKGDLKYITNKLNILANIMNQTWNNLLQDNIFKKKIMLSNLIKHNKDKLPEEVFLKTKCLLEIEGEHEYFKDLKTLETEILNCIKSTKE